MIVCYQYRIKEFERPFIKTNHIQIRDEIVFISSKEINGGFKEVETWELPCATYIFYFPIAAWRTKHQQ